MCNHEALENITDVKGVSYDICKMCGYCAKIKNSQLDFIIDWLEMLKGDLSLCDKIESAELIQYIIMKI